VLGRSRPIVAQPLEHALAARHRAVGIFASKPGWLERFLETAKLTSSMQPSRMLLGDLAGKAYHETKAILEVSQFDRYRERLECKPLESQQQPGKRLDESRVEVVTSECPQQDLDRVTLWTRLPAIGESRVLEPGERVLNPQLGTRFADRGR